jgi:DNA-binding protein HU-beta
LEGAAVNKNDLIQKLADHTGIDKNTSAKAVDGVFDLIASTLKSGDEVRLTGFGAAKAVTRRRAKKSPSSRPSSRGSVPASS